MTKDPKDIQRCQDLRHEVFVKGQGVPKAIEVDGRDGQCWHIMAELDGRLLGVARMRTLGDCVKAERVAVLSDYRHEGIGRMLMEGIHGKTRQLGVHRVVLSAQVQVVPFYLYLGYRREGEVYSEAGIDHQRMFLDM